MDIPVMTLTEFKSTPVGKIEAQMPVGVTADGDVKFIVCDPKDIILLKPLHIRVQNMVKNMVARAEQSCGANMKFDLPVKE